MLTDEPEPRDPAGQWSAFTPVCIGIEPLVRPKAPPSAQFFDVLDRRRSSVSSSIGWPQIAELLWYAAGVRGSAREGRAGLPIQWSATPTAGGLNCLGIVCVQDDGSSARYYDPVLHRFLILAGDVSRVGQANRRAIKTVTGTYRGCTLRFIGDWTKLSAAYSNAESLLLRDAGCLMATVGLCAAWLGLSACPLGFLGNNLLPDLGFPTDRFRAVGAILIGGETA